MNCYWKKLSPVIGSRISPTRRIHNSDLLSEGYGELDSAFN